MSLLSWFSPKKKGDAQVSVLPSSGLSRLESTKPYPQTKHGSGGSAQPGNRKQERMERRELLYAVVREAMVRAGVLSSSYKFKVLSLDPRGRQFMVMVDLAQGAASDTTRLAEIEAMVAQSAKARYDILVSAVYWRANEHVAIGDPAHFTPGKPLISQPAPLVPEHVSRPAELREAPPLPGRRFEPLQDDEVAAFRKALDAGVRGEQALASVNNGRTPQSYTLLTGFEDTEMAEGEDGQLSKTQYGSLR
ncbi:MAG TPA: hypothetical protein VGD76_20915 [Ramlibacter sp.]